MTTYDHSSDSETLATRGVPTTHDNLSPLFRLTTMEQEVQVSAGSWPGGVPGGAQAPSTAPPARPAHVEMADQLVGAVIALAELTPALGVAFGPFGWYDPADDFADLELGEIITARLAEHLPAVAAQLLVALRSAAEEMDR